MNSATYDFSGEIVVITGAAGGLGSACAHAFVRAGADVVLVGRTRQTLDVLANELSSLGGRPQVLVCDVTDDSSIEQSLGRLPRCDVLVNNAGSNAPQPFLDVDPDTLDRLLALNVRSAFRVSQCLARDMVNRRRGVIIHMSSQMGHVGAPNRTVYCMTKHAIEGLTKAMAVELAPHGVRVVSVAPTYVVTPLTAPYFENEAFRASVTEAIPMHRLGSADEVAATVLFASSAQASLITGTSLLVDGGYTAR